MMSRVIACPHCSYPETKVYTVHYKGARQRAHRYRRCCSPTCAHEFQTIEITRTEYELLRAHHRMYLNAEMLLDGLEDVTARILSLKRDRRLLGQKSRGGRENV